MAQIIITGIVMGMLGTIAMDIWAEILNRIFKQPKPNWTNVGRWFGHALRGKLFHDDIGKAQPKDSDLKMGWFFHYLVGVIYGIAFALFIGAGWLAAPTFVPVWIFALLTISAGWFLLHPGMGLGIALSKTPTPNKARLLGLISHTTFGIGMWAGAVIMA